MSWGILETLVNRASSLAEKAIKLQAEENKTQKKEKLESSTNLDFGGAQLMLV